MERAGPPGRQGALVVVHDLGFLLSGRARSACRPDPSCGPPAAGPAPTPRCWRATGRVLEAVASSEARTALDSAVTAARRGGGHPAGPPARAICTAAGPAAPATTSCPRCGLAPAASPAELTRRSRAAWPRAAEAMGVDQGILLVRLEQTEAGVFGLFRCDAGALPTWRTCFAGRHGGGRADRRLSLQLLPSLLETKRAAAVQRFAVDGYASIERRGKRGRPVARELAHDPEALALRPWGTSCCSTAPNAPTRVAAAPRPPGRRQRVDAGAARWSHAGWGWRWPRSWLGGRRHLAVVLRQPAAPPDRGRGAGPARAAVPAGLPIGAGRNYAPGVLRSARGWPAGGRGRRQVAITSSPTASATSPPPPCRRLRRRPPCTASSCCLPAAGSSSTCPAERPPGHIAESIAHPAERRRRALDVVQDVVASTRRRLKREAAMPTREEAELKERADRSLRTAPRGRGAVAVPLAAAAGDGVRGRAFTRAGWRGAVGLPGGWAHARGGLRAAGAAALRRRRADIRPEAAPIEWALAASRRGQRREAAEVLSRPGYPALAALELDAANDRRARARCGSGCCNDARCATALRDRRWCISTGPRRCAGWAIAAAARRAWARTQELLEQLADEFERRGQRERAFDCYGMLLRLGRDSGSFENVAEGYLNAIRLLAATTRSSTSCSTTRTSWPTPSRAGSGRRPPPWRARRRSTA